MTCNQFKDTAIDHWKLSMGYWAWLFAFMLAAPLCAQTPPTSIPTPQASESKESFVLEPSGLATGAQNATLRMIANTTAGFASSSSRLPEVKFGEGVKLITGSFKLLNANEAECKVNVELDAVGVCDVSLIFYSVNGTKVLSTQRATLGLLGPTKVGNIDVSVEDAPVVRVNVTQAQAAGVVALKGNLAGAVTLTAPTGTRFSKAPTPTTNKGTISGAALAENNTQFNFTINSGQADTIVRVTDISYDTSLFTTTGGVLGALNLSVGGAALGGQSTLLANAHTALTTIAGSNDNTDAPAGGSGSQGSNSSSGDTPTTGGTSQNNPAPSAGSSRTRENDRGERANRNNEDNNRNSGGRSVNAPAQGGGNAPRESNPPPPAVRGPDVQPAPGGRAEPPRGPAAPAPAPGGKSSSGGDGSATMGDSKPGEEKPKAQPEEPKPVLITTPGIYFCDKDFKPLDILVLNSLVSDKAGARVWIVVKLKADKTADIDTIDVTLRVCGVSRTLKLTETGKTTGEFRCDKAGVLLVSEEDPDSNVTEEKKVAVKPRPSALGK